MDTSAFSSTFSRPRRHPIRASSQNRAQLSSWRTNFEPTLAGAIIYVLLLTYVDKSYGSIITPPDTAYLQQRKMSTYTLCVLLYSKLLLKILITASSVSLLTNSVQPDFIFFSALVALHCISMATYWFYPASTLLNFPLVFFSITLPVLCLRQLLLRSRPECESAEGFTSFENLLEASNSLGQRLVNSLLAAGRFVTRRVETLGGAVSSLSEGRTNRLAQQNVAASWGDSAPTHSAKPDAVKSPAKVFLKPMTASTSSDAFTTQASQTNDFDQLMRDFNRHRSCSDFQMKHRPGKVSMHRTLNSLTAFLELHNISESDFSAFFHMQNRSLEAKPETDLHYIELSSQEDPTLSQLESVPYSPQTFDYDFRRFHLKTSLRAPATAVFVLFKDLLTRLSAKRASIYRELIAVYFNALPHLSYHNELLALVMLHQFTHMFRNSKIVYYRWNVANVEAIARLAVLARFAFFRIDQYLLMPEEDESSDESNQVLHMQTHKTHDEVCKHFPTSFAHEPICGKHAGVGRIGDAFIAFIHAANSTLKCFAHSVPNFRYAAEVEELSEYIDMVRPFVKFSNASIYLLPWKQHFYFCCNLALEKHLSVHPNSLAPELSNVRRTELVDRKFIFERLNDIDKLVLPSLLALEPFLKRPYYDIVVDRVEKNKEKWEHLLKQ